MESEIYGGHIFMKKILSFILATVLLLSLAACSKGKCERRVSHGKSEWFSLCSKSVF